jgi:hypothetical protein
MSTTPGLAAAKIAAALIADALSGAVDVRVTWVVRRVTKAPARSAMNRATTVINAVPPRTTASMVSPSEAGPGGRACR